MAVAAERMPNTGRKLKEFRLTQYHVSDRELLGVLDKVADNDGLAQSVDVASAFWPKEIARGGEGAKQAVAAVSRRFGYMAANLGIIARAPGSGLAKWSLTDEGHALLDGRLRAAVERGLDEMSGAQAVTAMAAMSQRINGERGSYGQMMVRAFRSGYGKRS